MNILGLLERIERDGMSNDDCCPSCHIGPNDKPDKAHFDNCELKAAIDALRSGRLVVCDKPVIIKGFGVTYKKEEVKE